MRTGCSWSGRIETPDKDLTSNDGFCTQGVSMLIWTCPKVLRPRTPEDPPFDTSFLFPWGKSRAVPTRVCRYPYSIHHASQHFKPKKPRSTCLFKQRSWGSYVSSRTIWRPQISSKRSQGGGSNIHWDGPICHAYLPFVVSNWDGTYLFQGHFLCFAVTTVPHQLTAGHSAGPQGWASLMWFECYCDSQLIKYCPCSKVWCGRANFNPMMLTKVCPPGS